MAPYIQLPVSPCLPLRVHRQMSSSRALSKAVMELSCGMECPQGGGSPCASFLSARYFVHPCARECKTVYLRSRALLPFTRSSADSSINCTLLLHSSLPFKVAIFQSRALLAWKAGVRAMGGSRACSRAPSMLSTVTQRCTRPPRSAQALEQGLADSAASLPRAVARNSHAASSAAAGCSASSVLASRACTNNKHYLQGTLPACMEQLQHRVSKPCRKHRRPTHGCHWHAMLSSERSSGHWALLIA